MFVKAVCNKTHFSYYYQAFLKFFSYEWNIKAIW